MFKRRGKGNCVVDTVICLCQSHGSGRTKLSFEVLQLNGAIRFVMIDHNHRRVAAKERSSAPTVTTAESRVP